MKSRSALVTAVIVVGLSGCVHHHDDPEMAAQRNVADTEVETNKWMVQAIRDTAETNGIIAQHTLFPYHFVPGRGELNGLGRRDLDVLTDSYKGGGGDLNVNRGTESDAVYEERVRHVRDVIAAAGVEADRVRIAEGQAGGPGLPSEHVVSILKATKVATPTDTYTSLEPVSSPDGPKGAMP